MLVVQIHNDEPALVDTLGRTAYVRALSQVLQSSETPLVVGIYGSWGSGKTSLLKQLQDSLLAHRQYRAVWYDPWQHQFDEHPAVALLQATYDQLSLAKSAKRSERIKALVLGISYALTKSAVTHVPIVGSDLSVVIDQAGKINDSIRNQQLEQTFQKRELQQHLHESFTEFVMTALEVTATDGEPAERLFFFVDDLDRCTPDRVVSLLESFKLFLNVPRCVFILGLDKEPVEAAIKQRYSWAKSSQAEYLDKIIQLELVIPPVALATREVFVRDSLARVFGETSSATTPLTLTRNVVRLLAIGVGGNPRQLKRAVSSFSLMHILGNELVSDYIAEKLALALLIQQKAPDLLRALTIQPERIGELIPPSNVEGKKDHANLYNRFVADDYEFASAIKLAAEHIDSELLVYLQLAEPGRELGPEHYLPEILDLHRRYVHGHSDGQQAVLDGITLTGMNLNGCNLAKSSLVAATLNSATLVDADLSDANLSDSAVERTNFTRSHFAGALARNLQASGAIFDESNLIQSDLSGSYFPGASFVGARLEACQLYGTCFDGANFTQAVIEEVDWAPAHSLAELDFSHSSFVKCNFSGARITDASFQDADGWSSCGLVRSDFSKCDLRKADLEEVDLTDSTLVEAQLSDANLRVSKLCGADLRAADLEGSCLEGADLSGTILDDAKLLNARAANANFCGASLRRVDMSEADLWNSDFSGALLNDAIVSDDFFELVLWDEYTVWPDGTTRRLPVEESYLMDSAQKED